MEMNTNFFTFCVDIGIYSKHDFPPPPCGCGVVVGGVGF